MDNKIVLEILHLIETLPDDKLKIALEEYHESDIADAIEALDDEETIVRLNRILSKERFADIVEEIEDQEEVLSDLTVENIAKIVDEMDSNEAHQFLDSLDDDKKEEILKLVDDETKEDIELLDSYKDDEVGNYMATEFACVDNTDMSVTRAMRKVIDFANKTDNFSIIYVNNPDGTYRGLVLLQDLIIARRDDNFDDLIKENYPVLHDKDNTVEAFMDIEQYELDSMPILDSNNHLVGILLSDVLKDFISDAQTEKYNRLALVEGQDVTDSVFKNALKRLPWLLGLLVVAIVVCMTSTSFELIIAPLVTIVFFQSMIADMAGNVGTQSLAVTISKDFTAEKDQRKKKNLFQEVSIGFLNGIILGIVAFIVVAVVLLIMNKKADIIPTALTVSLSIFVVSIISAFLGSGVPLLLIKLKIDPAIASGPAITTINDIVAVLTYFGLACLMYYVIFA